MSTFTVKVIKINAIEPIPNADNIELAVVNDYRSVVRKGQYKVGDLAVYIPEGAIIPVLILKELNLEGKLAGREKNHVKAIKLRGCISQGILYPVIKSVPEKSIVFFGDNGQPQYQVVTEGMDVAEFLNIKKYEPPIPNHMSGEIYNAGLENTIKFDIENIKSHPDVFKDDEQVCITEKIHGCVSEETKITLPNGESVCIKNIINDNNITHLLSFDIKTQKYVSKQITGKLKRPNIENKQWIKLTLENGQSLIITEDHPIFSRDRKQYIPAKEINFGEDIESFIDAP